MKVFAEIYEDGRIKQLFAGLNSAPSLECIEVSEEIIRNSNQYRYENGEFVYYPLILITSDKPSIIADGTDTATITAQVDGPTSTEVINFYINGELVSSENAVNGAETIQINATQTGEIIIEAESTTKYGRNSITLQAVSV